MACPSENTLVEYLEHRLPEGAGDGFQAHLRDCPSCQELLAQLEGEGATSGASPYAAGTMQTLSSAGPSSETLPVGSKLGRFLVLGPLGSGGMAVVYSAYDPQLDR